MTITNVLAEVFVADLDAALAWYARLFGCPADRAPMDGLAEWQLTDTGGLQVFHDAERAGTAMLTLGVDDLETHLAALAERGLTPEANTATEFIRTATVTDPDGNKITFAEDLTAGG